MNAKSRRKRRLNFFSGGNLRSFPRKLNFVGALYEQIHFSFIIFLPQMAMYLRIGAAFPVRIRAVFEQALSVDNAVVESRFDS